MNLKYYLLPLLLINNCSGCHNNNNENSKTEKPIPIHIKPFNNIYDNIISDIKSYVEDKKPLPKDIQNKIEKLLKKKDILDSQKKNLNDIKNNLNNKDELKKIINNVNSIIIGTIKVKEYMVTTKDKGLPLLHIDKSNNISKDEVLNNIKIFINGKNVDKDKLIIDDYHYIDYKPNNSQESKTLNVCIEISNALMKKIIDMGWMFWNTKYISLDLSNFDTSNVTSMMYMFASCKKLKEIKGINNFNTSNVINMGGMFADCVSLEFLSDISKWNTSNVKDMKNMFENCDKLRDIPKWYKDK